MLGWVVIPLTLDSVLDYHLYFYDRSYRYQLADDHLASRFLQLHLHSNSHSLERGRRIPKSLHLEFYPMITSTRPSTAR